MTRISIDLNSDLGEGIGNDAAVMPFISSANIACGYHAGDRQSMRETVRLAKQNGVAIGAHPGYRDKATFGRTAMNLPPSEVEELVYVQIILLQKIAAEEGCSLAHVKPHGALYNQAAVDSELAKAIARAILRADAKLAYVGLANSEMGKAAADYQLQFVSEVFADRAYTNNGQLVSRTLPGAVLHDAATITERVIRMVTQAEVVSVDGLTIPIQADSICLHGDNPEAVELAQAIFNAIRQEGITIEAPCQK